MTKLKKALLLLMAAVMTFTLLSVGASAATTPSASMPGFYKLYLYLASYGATDITLNREKSDSSNYVDVEELLVTTEYTGGVWLRVRDGSTNAAATNAGQIFYYDSWWRPAYLSGYGIVKNEYYIKGQTSSSSAYDASVTGYWRP